jgi:hypothetical protein
MATVGNVSFVEKLIDYFFVNKSILRDALIAAVEHENDGNRKLSNLGTSLVEFLTIYIGFRANKSRSRYFIMDSIPVLIPYRRYNKL